MKKILVTCSDKVRVGELSEEGSFRCEKVALWARGLNLENLRGYLDGSNPSYPHPAWSVISLQEITHQGSEPSV